MRGLCLGKEEFTRQVKCHERSLFGEGGLISQDRLNVSSGNCLGKEEEFTRQVRCLVNKTEMTGALR